MLCVSGALLGLSFLGPSASYAEIIWPLIVLGVGGGLFHPPNNSATLNNVASEHLSVANSFLVDGAKLRTGDRGSACGDAPRPETRTGGLWGGTGRTCRCAAWRAAPGGLSDSQQFAFRLAAVLGLVGAVISVLRGAEVSVASLASQDPVERTKDGQEVGGASRAEQRAAPDRGGIR